VAIKSSGCTAIKPKKYAKFDVLLKIKIHSPADHDLGFKNSKTAIHVSRNIFKN